MGATLATLRNIAFQLCDQANTVTQSSSPNDVVNTGFVPVSEMNKYINMGYKNLYGLLSMSYEMYFVTSYDFALVNSTEDYSLPSDFQQLIGVDLLPGNDSSKRVTIAEFSWNERNKYRDFVFTLYGTHHEWHIINNNMRIAPLPGSNGDYIRIHYVPTVTELSADTDQVVTENIFDEYISTYAAIRAIDKEETDSSMLRANLAELKQFVIDIANSRQVASSRPVAESEDSYHGQLTGSYTTGYGEF